MLGDILNFGTMFIKSRENSQSIQLSSSNVGENIESYYIGDSYCERFTRQWIEVMVGNDTLYIDLNFASVNNDYNFLLDLHNQTDYIDKETYRTVILTEEEWMSIPLEYIEQIQWDEYKDVYVITKTVEEDKIVWLRYEGDGIWNRRLWGKPGEDSGKLYVNGFISVLYKSSEAWKKEDLFGENVYDIGSQHRPFGIRYKVNDIDNQVITVVEKLNGEVINVIEDFDKNKYGIVKINKDLFDPLELITQHTITLEATDGIQEDIQYITFRKTNNTPYIQMDTIDFGASDAPPEIWYEYTEPDGDTVTIIEKINGVQVRSFTDENPNSTVLSGRRKFGIPNEFWANCKPGVNRAEVIVIDSYGAMHRAEATFEKATPGITYTVFYAVEGNILNERVFESEDGTEELRGYTYSQTTKNKYDDLSLSGIDEGTEVKVWMVTHNPYASAKYKTSNTLVFRKSHYGKPIVTEPSASNFIEQDHSEYGTLNIKYMHDDVHYVDGVLTSRDPDRGLNDFDGILEINYYIDGKYGGIYPLKDNTIQIGETRSETIDFSFICPDSRSHTITYFVTIKDKVTGLSSSTVSNDKATAADMLPGNHYYNDEPADPIIRTDYLESFGDMLEYGFKSIAIYWDGVIDPDGDNVVYHMYLKTPKALNEAIKTTSIPSRQGPNVVEYTRIYRIEEKRDEKGNVVGSIVYYNDEGTYVKIQENDYLGIFIDYDNDTLGKAWPEKEVYSFVIEAHDERPWDNSYYGLYDSTKDENYIYSRRAHVYPDDVKLTIMPNLVDGLNDGEKGRITALYTHPEIPDREAIVDIYAYQDNQLVTKVYSGKFYPGIEQTITIDFTMYEHKITSESDKVLKRSKDITYYATATDVLGFTSLGKYKGMTLETIPYLEPDETGAYGYYIVNAKGITYDFNNADTFEYEGPVQVGKHYFNEEPPATTPQEYDPAVIGHDIIEIKWPHVADPDGDEVKYEIYVSNSISSFNLEQKMFFNDNHPDGQDYVEGENNEHAIVGTLLNYHKVIEVPASVAENYSQRFEISVKEYVEDSDINIWIVSKDPYINSYYRSGEVLRVGKGHEAKEIRMAYPRNDSVVYAKTPRILIYLGEDNLDQTVYVQWLENIYNNRDHAEYFSNTPNKTNVVIFKPPVPYTGVSGNKVTFSVWVHNRCTYGPKTYITYTYKNFFDNLSDDKLIPIKSSHINLFRQAINVTREAYGLDQAKFTREVRKDMLFENFDFNETKNAIMEINSKINNADPGEGLDYVNPLIVDVNDLDLVEYGESIEAGSYEEFLEWARLLYILENL